MTKTTTKKVTTNENPAQLVGKLEAALADLETRRAEIVAKSGRNDPEIGSLTHLASIGDQKAAAKLEAWTQRVAKVEAEELRPLDAEIAKAKFMLAEARKAEEQATERKHAEEAREIADRVDMLFTSADKHLSLALDALRAADGRIEELHRLGFTFPTANQLRLNAAFAIQTYLMRLPKYWWNELSYDGVRFLAPHERRTFSQFWSRMAEPISRGIAARLNETKTEKEVA